MSRFAGKLTYANVTSTLALFIALAGGVAFGAQAIVDDSKDIAAQSVVNSDVKKQTLKSNRLRDGAAVAGADVVPNSLGGAGINEGDLAQVPSAANAGHALTATSAATAGVATTAANADAVGGLAADQFARASQISSGGPVSTIETTQTALLTFPDLGLEIRTDGDADAAGEVRVVNTNTPGGREFTVTYGDNYQNSFVSLPGGNQQIQPGDTITGGMVLIQGRTAPGVGILVSCAFSANNADRRGTCLGIRAPAG